MVRGDLQMRNDLTIALCRKLDRADRNVHALNREPEKKHKKTGEMLLQTILDIRFVYFIYEWINIHYKTYSI